MKLSLSLFVSTIYLSATTNTAVVEAQAVEGCRDADGNLCGEFDSDCCGDYDVPDGPMENICPDSPTLGGSCKDKLEGVTCMSSDQQKLKCTGGTFVVGGDVGQAFNDPPSEAPKPPCTDAKDCSGEAQIQTINKEMEEGEENVADVVIGSGSATASIVSSIVGFTAIAGVVALL